MEDLSVSMTPEMAAFGGEQLATGRYASASEVVRDGLRLLPREETVAGEKLDLLRGAIALGLSDAAAGRFASRSAAEISAEIAERTIRTAEGAP